MPEKAKAVSIKVSDLSAAVEQAVAAAATKFDFQPGKELALGPGTLVGRIMREQLADVATLKRVSTAVSADVAKSMGLTKAAFKPATLIGDGWILVGFFPRDPIGF